MDAKQVSIFVWMFPRITEGCGYLPDTDYMFDKYDHRIVHNRAEATGNLRLNPLRFMAHAEG